MPRTTSRSLSAKKVVRRSGGERSATLRATHPAPDIDFFRALELRLKKQPDLRLQLAQNVHAALAPRGHNVGVGALTRRMRMDIDGGGGGIGDGGGTHPGTIGGTTSGGSSTASHPITAEAFWWGFHLVIPNDALTIITTSVDVVNTVVSLIGPETGPAAPFIEIAAAFVSLALTVLKDMDNGHGVYVSMTWLLPGIFVPTPRYED